MTLVVIGFFVYQSIQEQINMPLGPIATPIAVAMRPSPALAPTTPPIQYRIISTNANLSAPITELYYATDADTWDLTKLGDSAGHLEGTREMGQGGNFVLAGHVELKDGSAGPFAQIKSLKAGDRIIMFGQTQPNPIVKAYTVTEVSKVPPTDFGAIQNHGYEELTLITCDDWNPQGQTYSSRIVVHARPSETVANSAPSFVTTPRKS